MIHITLTANASGHAIITKNTSQNNEKQGFERAMMMMILFLTTNMDRVLQYHLQYHRSARSCPAIPSYPSTMIVD
jgi:hypothetical protein